MLYGSVTNVGGKSLAHPKVTVDWYASGGSVHQATVAVLDAYGAPLDQLDPGASGDLLVVVDPPAADQLADAQPSFGLAQSVRLGRPLLALSLVVLAVIGLAPSVAEARGMGSQPLDDIRFWADQKKACGLGTDQLAAMMLTVIYPEAGASGEQSPSPMTLSRYDTQAGLYAFGDKATPWQRAFWHPGVGFWAFDSAGGWNLTAVGAISTWTAAEQAATVMSTRWCANPTRAYVWAPWHGCATTSKCEAIYNDIFDGAQLRNITVQPAVTRDGGMEARTCTLNGATGVLLVHRSGACPRCELVGVAEGRPEPDHGTVLCHLAQRARDPLLVGPGHWLSVDDQSRQTSYRQRAYELAMVDRGRVV